MGEGTVDGESVGEGTVDGGSVGAGSVDGGSVGAGSLGEGSVDGGSMGEGSVDGGSMGEGSVDGGSVGGGSTHLLCEQRFWCCCQLLLLQESLPRKWLHLFCCGKIKHHPARTKSAGRSITRAVVRERTTHACSCGPRCYPCEMFLHMRSGKTRAFSSSFLRRVKRSRCLF